MVESHVFHDDELLIVLGGGVMGPDQDQCHAGQRNPHQQQKG